MPEWLIAAIHAAEPGPATASLPGALLFADISGFTTLTNTLTERHGAAGAERLSRALDRFFGLLLSRVRASGGHVASFAGDGLLAYFPAGDGGLAEAALAAARAGLDMTAAVAGVGPVEGVSVGLHAGVAAGECVGVRVGGHRGRWQGVVLGDPLAQLRACFAEAKRGETVLSPEAAVLLDGHVEQEGRILRRVLRPPALAERAPVPAPDDLDAWLPEAIRARADAPLGEWLAEIRSLSLLFVSFRDAHPASLAAAVRVIQEELDTFGGALHQVAVDEKGVAASCAFGLPGPAFERPGASAVRCALALEARFEALGVRAGMGLATGRLFVGPVGDAARRELGLVGPTMIRAARMASAGDRVLVDEATRDLAEHEAVYGEGPPTQLRGFATPQRTWRAVRPRRRALRGDGEALVGRAEARARIDAALAAHRAGEEVVVSLEGPAGIGKSRLAAEVVARARDAGVPVVEALGDLAEIDRPWHAWRTALERRLGIEEHAGPDARLRALRAGLAAMREDDGRMPLLGPVLGLSVPDNAATAALSAPGRAAETTDSVAALLARTAGPAGAVIVVDDAQWLDSGSAQVLAALRRTAKPALVVLAIRTGDRAPPEPVVALRDLPDAHRLELGALEPADVEQLLGVRLGVATIPAGITRWVRERSGGNPFFVREVAAALVGQGLAEVRDGRLVREPSVAELSAATPPASVEAIVTGRIDALPMGAQLALKSAAVLGMRFDEPSLAALHPQGPDAVGDAIAAIERAGLCLRRPDGTLEFAHRITLDVAYGLMVGDQRQRLHAAVAQRIEARASDERARLAWHWEHAGNAARALPWLEAAWQDADRSGAIAESHALARRAAALLGPDADPVRVAEWWRRMSDASTGLSQPIRAVEEARASLAALGRSLPETRGGWRLRLLGAVGVQLVQRFLPRALWARPVRGDDEAAMALSRAAEGFYFAHGDRLIALTCYLESANAGERAGVLGRVPNAFGVLGAALTALGSFRAGRWYCETGAREATAAGDARHIAAALFHLATSHSIRFAWDEADEVLVRSAAMCASSGNRYLATFVLTARALNGLLRGRFRDAAGFARELLALSEQVGHERGEAVARTVLATVALAAGDAAGALGDAKRARDMLRARDDLAWATAGGVAARAQLALGDEAAALAEARAIAEALRDAEPSDYRRLDGFAAPAEVLLAVREPPREQVDAALAIVGRFAKVYGVGRSRHALLRGLHLLRRGDRRGGEEALRLALREAEARGLTLDAARARIALADDPAETERTKRWLAEEGMTGFAA
ncbi:MAG: AAA family ATPase [Myxococcota bacterium]